MVVVVPDFDDGHISLHEATLTFVSEKLDMLAELGYQCGYSRGYCYINLNLATYKGVMTYVTIDQSFWRPPVSV